MQPVIQFIQVLVSTLGAMRRMPMTTINTVLVVAIALVLPTFLYIGVQTSQQLGETWEGRPQMTLFMQQNVDGSTAQLIFDEVRLNPKVARAELMSPDDALEEFRVLSATSEGLVDISAEIAFLGGNPLPFSIVLMPSDPYIEQTALTQLQREFAQIEEVESVKLDLAWVTRFNAIVASLTRLAVILAVLLAFGLVLIMGNTIKLLIAARRQEIEVTKLVGGTDRFVRRPFLFFGVLFGFFGALTSLVLLWGASVLLSSSLAALASSYGASQLMYSLSAMECVYLLLLGSALGWIAARWSVAQHIRKIRPQ